MVLKARQGGLHAVLFYQAQTRRFRWCERSFVQGVSTRKMEKLAKSLMIESLFCCEFRKLTKGLNEQAKAFGGCFFPKRLSHFVGGCSA